MKRVIVDFKKLTPEILKLLVEKYPDGYEKQNIITFKNASGETVNAVEVRTEDTIYLVKVSGILVRTMENYDEDDYEDFADDDPEAVQVPEGLEEEVENDEETEDFEDDDDDEDDDLD